MSSEEDIVQRVSTAPYYGQLFSEAFGDEKITITKIKDALGAFTGSISANNSLFDRHQQGLSSLSGIEEMGKNLFTNKYNCATCHQSITSNPYFFNTQFRNIGLDENYADKGVGALTNNPEDNGKFKVPSLKNIALTAPYMHDGRFQTLEEVIDHYSHGIANNPNLDTVLVTGSVPIRMNISTIEKSALIAFLHTLTDYSMVADPKFSNPFKAK